MEPVSTGWETGKSRETMFTMTKLGFALQLEQVKKEKRFREVTIVATGPNGLLFSILEIRAGNFNEV